jgi:hypothetical protein
VSPGLFVVLVDEPGRDLRALPGFFHDAETAIDEHVSFQEHPEAVRFLIVNVVGQVGPVRSVDSQGGPERHAAPRAALSP